MSESRALKIGIIGVGVMGRSHAKDVHNLEQAELTAICDIDKVRADEVAGQYGAIAYYDVQAMFEKAELDGVIIATPHYEHTPLSIEAFNRGIHVLVEKPIAVHAKNAGKMLTAYETAKTTHPKLVFAAMFMQRTYGCWKKINSIRFTTSTFVIFLFSQYEKSWLSTG